MLPLRRKVRRRRSCLAAAAAAMAAAGGERLMRRAVAMIVGRRVTAMITGRRVARSGIWRKSKRQRRRGRRGRPRQSAVGLRRQNHVKPESRVLVVSSVVYRSETVGARGGGRGLRIQITCNWLEGTVIAVITGVGITGPITRTVNHTTAWALAPPYVRVCVRRARSLPICRSKADSRQARIARINTRTVYCMLGRCVE